MISVESGAGAPYDAPQHYGVFGVLKLTKDHTKRTIINYSYFHPNGGAEMSSAPVERTYYVTKGSITVKGKNNGETHTLNAGDLIYIAPGEERELTVNNGQAAEVLVIVVEI
ncbi:MAG: cupin domain-containing protein [Desulfobacteraceae bacterium]|nr:cupin domain-containing protein [Desulfobacteraceae bacterium]